MNVQESIERVIVITTALICILIAVLDFVGALDSFPWISQRISIMTLLAIGLLALFYVIEGKRDFKNIEQAISETKIQVLRSIKPDEPNQQILEAIDRLWEEREPDIQRFLEQAINSNFEDYDSLRKFLHDYQNKFRMGELFGSYLHFSWDFDITAVNTRAVWVYHTIQSAISTRIWSDIPYPEVIRMKNGSLFWLNKFKTDRLTAIFPERHLRPVRLTKLYFREIEKLQVIVVFESHLSVLYELPKPSVTDQKSPEQSKIVQASFLDNTLSVELDDGRRVTLPLGWYPRLANGTPAERANFKISGAGYGIHWPDLDEDIGVEGLLLGKKSGESQASFERWLQRKQKVN